jgi:LysR family transcriptional regulator, low CO2-responsive transcriptional regulator
VTPTQLRAYVSVVRHGSVKAAAEELSVSEAAVSMHVAQLRKEFGDQLFSRTASGLAFTPGGLRLASRAVEMLGLQERTRREVSRAAEGRRMLRLAATAMFAEHAAPGLIERFARRADDLDVELSVHRAEDFPGLLASRTVDISIGPSPLAVPDGVAHKTFLNYDVVAVTGLEHPLAGQRVHPTQLLHQTWLVGPSAVERSGVVSGMLRQLAVPEQSQRIFQSDAAALEEAQRSEAIALALRFSVTGSATARRIVPLEGPGLHARGAWSAMALAEQHQSSATAELLRFITTPRAIQAMVRGTGVEAGRFRPSVHVTLWS